MNGPARVPTRTARLVLLAITAFVLHSSLTAAAADRSSAAPSARPGSSAAAAAVPGTNVLYTTDLDFGQGTLADVGLETPGQLGLSSSGRKLRLLWLTRNVDYVTTCTLVKINTDTGAVLGEYRTSSEGD